MKATPKCPHCGSYNTQKTVNGMLSDAAAKVGSVVGGALINMATGGIGGIIGANIGYGRTWHQFCCHNCHESFKARLGVCGNVKEVKGY